jgi:hypothetical protein
MKTYSISCISCLFAALLPLTVLGFCFENAGTTYGINPTLLESIARVESNMNPKAINKNTNGTSDIGLMQINSAWLRSMRVNANDLLNDPCLNTMTGAWILRQCIDRHGYGWEAVGCYNAMSRNKKVNYAWKVFQQLKNEQRKSPRTYAHNPKTVLPHPRALASEPTAGSSLPVGIQRASASRRGGSGSFAAGGGDVSPFNGSTGDLLRTASDVTAKPKSNQPALKPAASSLVFRVRDITETERGAP